MTDKTLQERLREHRVILKSGEYDGAQLMAAWCDMVNAADAIDAQAERIKALEGALRDVIADRDSRAFERERYKTCELDGIAGYWTPSATMVGSEVISKARALLGEK